MHAFPTQATTQAFTQMQAGQQTLEAQQNTHQQVQPFSPAVPQTIHYMHALPLKGITLMQAGQQTLLAGQQTLLNALEQVRTTIIPTNCSVKTMLYRTSRTDHS